MSFGFGSPFAPRPHRPDALARVVGEEQGVAVGGRVRPSLVEGETRDRAAPERAGLAGDDRARVRVRVVRGVHRRRAGRVEVRADVHAGVLPRRRRGRALVAGPAGVLDRPEHIGDAVDLFPAAEADVPDPELGGARAERDPEGVAHAVGDDPARIQVGAGEERVRRQRRPVIGVDPDDRAVEGDRVAARAQVLRAQASALRRRWTEDGADAARRVAARVQGVAVLAPVGEAERGAVSGGGVERPVGAELDLALRVARVLLAPVRDEHGLHPGRAQRERRPETTHPSTLPPGGFGHGSEVAPAVPQRGAVPPMAASCV